jgi:hypothetical protein
MIDDKLLKDKGFLKTWIETRTDNEIKNITLERQIFAFYLLEKLVESKVEFIFKGGSALILILEKTQRFSTDIDILIAKPRMEKLEELFASFVNQDAIFSKYERVIRADSKFPKVHYMFFFQSIFKNDDQGSYILLDAVFEDNPYQNLELREIRNSVLPSIEPYIQVNLPSITDIMIDKLTAFAPHTIGVKFERILADGSPQDHSREVIKQWFDVNELYQKCTVFNDLDTRYLKLSDFEMKQRDLQIDYKECLMDTYRVVICFLSRGKTDPSIYEKLKKGVRRLFSFVNVDLSESYLISASVNVIELISKVLCNDSSTYQELHAKSKEEYSYEVFIKEKKLKSIVNLVRVNNPPDRDRFIVSMRVIGEIIGI